MNKSIPLIIIILIAGLALQNNGSFFGFTASAQNTDQIIQQAYYQKQSGIQIQGTGIVVKILSDDLKGSKHQRLIVKINSGLTLLIAHNIDLAQRLNGISTGASIEFNGEYEWNSKGGVIHWTHHDPAGRHQSGWLKYNGKTYQ